MLGVGHRLGHRYLPGTYLHKQHGTTGCHTWSMQNGSRNRHSIIMKHAPPPGPAPVTLAPRLYGGRTWLSVTMMVTATVHKKVSMARVVRFLRKKPNLSCLTIFFFSKFGGGGGVDRFGRVGSGGEISEGVRDNSSFLYYSIPGTRAVCPTSHKHIEQTKVVLQLNAGLFFSACGQG